MKNMKGYTIPITKDMATARADLRTSTKSSQVVCKKLNRRKFADAKKYAERLIKEEVSIEGCYYTKTAEEILKMLKALEFNAKNRDMEPASMRLNISAHQGPRMMRGRRNRHHGMRLKMTHMQAVLIPVHKEEKKTAKKEEKKETKK